MNEMEKPLFVKVVATEWKSATHDKRELKVAKELGYDTLVIANTKSEKKIFEEYVDEFRVVRIPTRHFGEGRLRKILGRFWAIVHMIKKIKQLDVSVISGHNYSGWVLGFIAKRKDKNVKYIYDSHEFELYQDGSGRIRRFFIYLMESYIFKHTTMTYTVTESIADDLKKIYSLEEKPIVVRNIPEKMEYNREHIDKNRKEFLDNLEIDSDGTILMYHGGITSSRGIEQAIEALTKTKNTGLVIMGFALNQTYLDGLKNRINEINCEKRVYFKDAVNFPELYEYVAAADIGIVLSRNTCINHFYSLPNKLFENIQALTPVIASDFPEITKIVNRFDIGITIEPDDIEQLAKSISEIKEKLGEYENNIVFARDSLCWQNEKNILSDAIKKKCINA